MPTEITIPKRALAVLCGPSAAGKSTWSREHFLQSQIVASDRCRQMVSDGLNWHEPAVSEGAFTLLYDWVEQRLRLNRLTVVDSTALMTGTRRHLRSLARKWHAPAVLVVFGSGLEICRDRDRARPDSVGMRVLRRQFKQLAHESKLFEREDWHDVIVLDSDHQIHTPVKLTPLPHERPDDNGPFDIIGDVHGCREELEALLSTLGWERDAAGVPFHPAERRAIFVGDIGCGGPDTLGCWRTVLAMRHARRAEVLIGDHDMRLLRLLGGEPTPLTQGLNRVAEQLARVPSQERESLRRDIANLVVTAPPHLLLDQGQIAVAHAGLRDEMVGKTDRQIVNFCRHAEGPRHPRRGEWVNRHLGHELVVHGHAPTASPEIRNHTLNIDTGCVLGGRLTALRWPERHLVQVPAQTAHWGKGWECAQDTPLELALESSVA